MAVLGTVVCRHRPIDDGKEQPVAEPKLTAVSQKKIQSTQAFSSVLVFPTNYRQIDIS
jgi:hypothetical protein